MRPIILWAAVAAIASSGCIAEIFVDTTLTTREFLCAALRDDPGGKLVVDARLDPDMAYGPEQVLLALPAVLASISERAPDAIQSRLTDIDSMPPVWDDDAWDQELAGHRPLDRKSVVRLTVYWVQDLPGDGTGIVVEPGVIAIDQNAVNTLAIETGQELSDVALTVLLHHVGHALGGVNQGVPMQANHEGLPGHDADVDSVMHHVWHGETLASGINSTPHDYASAMRDDWQAVMQDKAVCP